MSSGLKWYRIPLGLGWNSKREKAAQIDPNLAADFFLLVFYVPDECPERKRTLIEEGEKAEDGQKTSEGWG